MNIVFMSMDTLPSTLWARDLYDQMHIRSDFRKWFPRMCQYGFIEGRDYEYMPRVRLQDEGGRTVQRYVKDYRITQDMAKKLCKRLVEHIFNLLHVRTERKIVRDNFVGIHVQDWRKIALPPRQRKLGHIRCPLLQRPVCAEISIDNIVGYLAYFASVGMVFLLRTFSSQSQPVHNVLHTFMVYRKAALNELLMYSSYTISPSIFFEYILNFS